MALQITHPYVSAIADSGDTSVVQPSDWNDDHTIAGLGTGVETALGVNVGSAGAFVTFNGALGTPSSGVATNLTGTAAGLTAGTVTTNANLTGVVTSVGNATAIADAALSIAKTSGLQAALDAKQPLDAALTTLAAGSDFVQFTGPTTATKVFTLPDASSTILYSGGALGTPSSGTLTNATGLPIGGISATGTPGATTYLRGDGTWNTPAGGSSTWDTIGAAAGDGSTNNGTNRIVYNTAPTADSRIAWRFSESTAASGGTSTSGVPNQVLLQLDTLASSTQSPLKVLSRGSHVFSVSPTAAQILATNGSASEPAYSFAASTNTGVYCDTSGTHALRLVTAGGTRALFLSGYGIVVASGTANTPGVTDLNNSTDGLWWPSGGNLGIAVSSIENSRFVAGAFQVSKGTADAVSYAINARKSRGTVASPTVITTGDDLLTISGYGYVGATGTYVEASRITADSDGTIANNSTGVGGIWRLSTRKVGGFVTERMTVDNNETADETSILVSINGGAPVRVSKGAAGSGGTGFAVLRIPN